MQLDDLVRRWRTTAKGYRHDDDMTTERAMAASDAFERCAEELALLAAQPSEVERPCSNCKAEAIYGDVVAELRDVLAGEPDADMVDQVRQLKHANDSMKGQIVALRVTLTERRTPSERWKDRHDRMQVRAEKAEADVEQLKAEVRRLQIGRIGDSEIIGREMCRAEAAEAKLTSPPPPSGWQRRLATSVWVIYRGNYYPREVIGICASEKIAREKLLTGEDCEEWAVLGADEEERSPSGEGWPQRIAAMRPWHACAVTDKRRCFYCGEYQDSITAGGAHKSDCLWQNAKDALPSAPDSTSEPEAFASCSHCGWISKQAICPKCGRERDSGILPLDSPLRTLAPEASPTAALSATQMQGLAHAIAGNAQAATLKEQT